VFASLSKIPPVFFVLDDVDMDLYDKKLAQWTCLRPSVSLFLKSTTCFFFHDLDDLTMDHSGEQLAQ
jgi:hypothetical protein